MTDNGSGGSFWNNENVLKVQSGNGYTTLCNHWIVYIFLSQLRKNPLESSYFFNILKIMLREWEDNPGLEENICKTHV